MNFNFELILFYFVVVSGLLALIDILFFAKKRQQRRIEKMPLIFDYARSFFPVLLLVFFLRSFLVEPFRIPSGSLEPTLHVGDFILVNKYAYGVRLPVIHKMIYPTGKPERGDIVVFRWPPKPEFDFIKRVIGLPGDHVSYINKVLFINGQEIPQELTRKTSESGDEGVGLNVDEKTENLFNVKHSIYQFPNDLSKEFKDVVVPEGMYFVMGDNRDNSQDSRFWGFVPNTNLVGKAFITWMSWDGVHTRVRWDRIGKPIH